MTAVTVSGSTAATSGPATVVVPYPGTIANTYSAAPTWAWSAAQLPSGATPATAAVSATAPAGGQAGVIPQTTFLAGTAIVLDPAGPLYAAIGAGNLMA